MTEATIFMAALDKPTEAERAAFLEEACAGDERLLRPRRGLVEGPRRTGRSARSDDGLAPYVRRDGASVPDSEQAGAIVAGRYKLLEAIGEGGMGTVWMTEQREPVKRLVALKLIKPGMDSKAVLARFEAERQALALMDHPNIAKILDGGTTRDEPGGVGAGRPYFVMELVKGRPLTEYCDESRLSINDRLDLFVQICSAVQHAHQKGIIHRDLKPSNLLVTEHDGKPVPKVIDFGLAKALAPSAHSPTGRSTPPSARSSAPPCTCARAGGNQRAGRRHPERHLRAGRRPLRALDRDDAAGETAAQAGLLGGGPARDPGGGAAAAEPAAVVEQHPCEPGGEPPDRAAEAHSDGARRTRLDRHEVPGQGSGPPLRNGQRPGARHRALSARRTGRGLTAVAAVSTAQVRASTAD